MLSCRLLLLWQHSKQPSLKIMQLPLLKQILHCRRVMKLLIPAIHRLQLSFQHPSAGCLACLRLSLLNRLLLMAK
jgi:hypothetical protein